ncbi:MAG: tRNA pseudouridine(38-40) synthase TruA [Methanobacteriota archaeon]|nr:MAG: tRNA pseudouridine(38-40) synthase TruA [Euryarchaeota archaeon]
MTEDRRVAVKLAYDGSNYYGFQRQPGMPTVEGELITALEDIGNAKASVGFGIRSSSRTDRGVSALGNVVSFRTDFRLRSLCSALNSALDTIWTYSAVEVDDDFNPRWAKQRWYRYFLPVDSQDPSIMREVAERFVGTHDFSGFARLDGRNPVRTVDSIDITESDSLFFIDFRAESFLWNMVRRIVWFIDAVASGTIDLDEYELDTGRRPGRVGLAPSEYLVLMDVDCGIAFPHDSKAASAIRRVLNRRIIDLDLNREFSKQLLMRLRSS